MIPLCTVPTEAKQQTDQNKDQTIQVSHHEINVVARRAVGLTAALLRLRILRLANLHHLAALSQRVLSRVAVKGLAGHDAIDFWFELAISLQAASGQTYQ